MEIFIRSQDSQLSHARLMLFACDTPSQIANSVNSDRARCKEIPSRIYPCSNTAKRPIRRVTTNHINELNIRWGLHPEIVISNFLCSIHIGKDFSIGKQSDLLRPSVRREVSSCHSFHR